MSPVIESMPVLIVYPHRRCNCRCQMCDIWKETSHEEFSYGDLEGILPDIQRLGTRWLVFSGGEPLMHSDLFRLCSLVRNLGIRVTVLTTGLLLERYAQSIVDCVDDVIVSVDGPEPVHDSIRRTPGAFARIVAGIKAIRTIEPHFPISARSTIQLSNHHVLLETARAAYRIGCSSISFLAVDVASDAFNRKDEARSSHFESLALSEAQIENLECSIAELLSEWGSSGFVVEDAKKFARIIHHFRAHLGLAEPIAPRCNAPWVSAVVESDGQVRPCFFHKPIGRIGDDGLLPVLNGFLAQAFRASLDVRTNPICQRCVCSLHLTEAVHGHSRPLLAFTKVSHKANNDESTLLLSSDA